MSELKDNTFTMWEYLKVPDTVIDEAMDRASHVPLPSRHVTWKDRTDFKSRVTLEETPPGHDLSHRQKPPVERAKVLKNLAGTWEIPVYLISFVTETSTGSTLFHLYPHRELAMEIAQTHEQIIAFLRQFGSDKVADRLIYLRRLADIDPEEPSIEIESLRAMGLFLLSERQLPDPQIGVTPDGLMQIEWRFGKNGILAMEFLRSGLVRFAAISAPTQRGFEPQRVNGTLLKADAIEAVRSFIGLI